MNPERPRHLPLYLSAGSPCGYLESRQSRNLFVDPDVAMNTVLYGQLLRRGFRRSGRMICTGATPPRGMPKGACRTPRPRSMPIS